MRKTTLLKKLILDKEILVMPGAYDALSAKIIEMVGFQCVTLGGYAASAASLAHCSGVRRSGRSVRGR